jgi:hypothetical protein
MLAGFVYRAASSVVFFSLMLYCRPPSHPGGLIILSFWGTGGRWRGGAAHADAFHGRWSTSGLGAKGGVTAGLECGKAGERL